MTSTLKTRFRQALLHTGLYDVAWKVRWHTDLRRARYRKIKKHNVIYKGKTVVFNTSDSYSNVWFFPRYENGELHERRVTERVIADIKDARCFVDVGTNIGWYTCMASKHMPQGVVYGFEMDNVNFELLKGNVEMNKCRNVEIYNVAVADVPGVSSYRRTSPHPSSVLKLKGNGAPPPGSESVTIETISLDSFFKDRPIQPDVLKIDVEGAEMMVLQGMREILATQHPVLFLEVHPLKLNSFGVDASQVLHILFDVGYEVSEIGDMRNQESDSKFVPINRDTVLTKNAMLYCRPVLSE